MELLGCILKIKEKAISLYKPLSAFDFLRQFQPESPELFKMCYMGFMGSDM